MKQSADLEEMDNYIAKSQKTSSKDILTKKPVFQPKQNAQSKDVAQRKDTEAKVLEQKASKTVALVTTPKHENDIQTQLQPTKEYSVLNQDIQNAMSDLKQFVIQTQIDRRQYKEAYEKREAKKLESVLKYVLLSLLPHGFTDEELF